MVASIADQYESNWMVYVSRSYTQLNGHGFLIAMYLRFVHDVHNHHVGLRWSLLRSKFTFILLADISKPQKIVISLPQFRADYGYLYQGQYVVPARWQLAFTAASVIGLILGGPPAAYIAKRWGRNACLWFGYCMSKAANIRPLVNVV